MRGGDLARNAFSLVVYSDPGDFRETQMIRRRPLENTQAQSTLRPPPKPKCTADRFQNPTRKHADTQHFATASESQMLCRPFPKPRSKRRNNTSLCDTFRSPITPQTVPKTPMGRGTSVQIWHRRTNSVLSDCLYSFSAKQVAKMMKMKDARTRF